MPDPERPRDSGPHPDRGFRVLTHILDDAARLEMEGVLIDSVTQLPSLQLLLTQIRDTLEERSQVGLITLIVNPFVRLEELFGWETYDQVVRTVAAALNDIKVETLRDEDSIAELSMSGNSFVLVLSPPRYNRFVLYEDVSRLRDRIGQKLRTRLAADFPPEVVSKFTCSIGCSVINHDPDVPMTRLVLRALDQAYSDAFQERDREFAVRATKLADIIESRDLVMLYQPIVDARAGTVLGYEAFTRGPAGEFQDPSYLFRLADEAQMLWKLERICREEALERAAADLPEPYLLFLNTDLDSIFDPELRRSDILRELASRVVLEINERAAIGDYPLFRRALEIVKDLGLRFAIDDVGSAYSGLKLIADVRPNFVKLDMAVTGDVQESVVKRDLVRTVASIADSLEAPLIVEGVESREELEALLDLGIRYAQGFLFGLPEPHFSPVDLAQLNVSGGQRSGPSRAAN